MSDQIAVKVDSVSKSFRIPLESSNGLKQKLINTLKGRKGYREFTPLSDISFDIKKGEFFGIVGRNGSGKSTLLKTIAGIYSPDKGAVAVNGKLVPFIELGVGFNPELSGRENVFLNGALLGFSHKEMEAMYDEIVDFAELHEFMEERLKNYSSGMQVRLAFSIAIKAEGDILLLDEVLAVGDEAFQRKCFDYFEKLRDDKKTVILVSHDMDAVKKYCTRAVLIDNGKLAMKGDPNKVSDYYKRLNNDKTTDQLSRHNQSLDSIAKVTLLNSAGDESATFNYGDVLRVRVEWDGTVYDNVKNVGVSIFKGHEYIYGTNTIKKNIDTSKGLVELDLTLSIGVAKLKIATGLFGDTDKDVIDYNSSGPEFMVTDSRGDVEYGGLMRLDSTWKRADN